MQLPSRSFQLGRYREVGGYFEAYERAGIELGRWAREMAMKTLLSPVLIDLEIFEVRWADLKQRLEPSSFPVSYEELYRRARERGWERCPAEAALAIREQWKDQGPGFRELAMDPVAVSGDYQMVFQLENNHDQPSINATFGQLTRMWVPGTVTLFTSQESLREYHKAIAVAA